MILKLDGYFNGEITVVENDYYLKKENVDYVKLDGNKIDFDINNIGNIIVFGKDIPNKHEKFFIEVKCNPIKYTKAEIEKFKNTFDNNKYIFNFIKTIDDLDEVVSFRRVLYKKFNIELSQILLYNSILIDNFGQILYKKSGVEDYAEPSMYYEEYKNRFFKKEGDKNITLNFFNYDTGKCSLCGEKFTLDDVKKNRISMHNRESAHEKCAEYEVYESNRKRFEYIVSSVFGNCIMIPVRNEYGSESYRGSWFIIKTNDGDIKIGWRKRVIEITWLDNYKQFRFDGEKYNSTKCFNKRDRYMHVYDTNSAIEVLLDVKNSIIK